MDSVAWFVFANEVRERAGGANFYAVDGSNDILIFEASLLSRATFDDGGIARGTIEISAAGNGEVVLFG